MDNIDRTMLHLGLDKATSRRIRGYFNYKWVRHRDHAGEDFIASLPYQLKMRTASMVHEPLLRTCPLFKVRLRCANPCLHISTCDRCNLSVSRCWSR